MRNAMLLFYAIGAVLLCTAFIPQLHAATAELVDLGAPLFVCLLPLIYTASVLWSTEENTYGKRVRRALNISCVSQGVFLLLVFGATFMRPLDARILLVLGALDFIGFAILTHIIQRKIVMRKEEHVAETRRREERFNKHINGKSGIEKNLKTS
jgi:hypothetical protein